MTYKITFNMTSPIVYMTLPIFDSILAYAEYCLERKISDAKTPHGSEINEIKLPLEKHPDYDFYLASYMFSDHIEEGLEAWRKRWDCRHDFMADFGKSKRKINTASGEFKSFDIPLVTQSAQKVWFYFDGDPFEVDFVIRNGLNGIGKKTSHGFGWFSDFEIEESKENLTLCRPLPIEFMKTNLKELRGYSILTSFGSWRMPYWKAEYQERIIIPSITKGDI
jgi:hypothetical protein